MNRMITWIRTHRYCLVGLYLLVFLLGFFWLEFDPVPPKYIIHCVIDDWIPFDTRFVLPYFLWYVWVPVFLVWFMFNEKNSYLRLCFIMFAGATFCLIIYVLLPNGLDLRRGISGDGFCEQIVRFLRWVDVPQNVCPSIHVSSTVSIHMTICRSQRFRGSRRMRCFSLGITLLICVSTLFIKQHSVIDVVCGWVLSEVLARICDRLIPVQEVDV
ncbi:MAG: phosphatidic acid phosphatase [Clostridiales bacterium]|nr:phosphatidic acid phosphatase [Clostridiales bacterium]